MSGQYFQWSMYIVCRCMAEDILTIFQGTFQKGATAVAWFPSLVTRPRTEITFAMQFQSAAGDLKMRKGALLETD
jgi:hypothetical protein